MPKCRPNVDDNEFIPESIGEDWVIEIEYPTSRHPEASWVTAHLRVHEKLACGCLVVDNASPTLDRATHIHKDDPVIIDCYAPDDAPQFMDNQQDSEEGSS